MTKHAWVRGLDSCLQLLASDRDDIEIEMGEVEYGELKARAFPQLQRVLTDEQVLAFGWIALADLACWPQLQPSEALALSHSIRSVSPSLPPRSAAARTPRDSGYRAAATVLRFIAQAQARLKQPSHLPVDFEPMRVAINALAHFRKNRVAFWEQWLRRVVETAAVLTPEEACACAVDALQHTISLPASFEYQATKPLRQPKSNTNGPFNLMVVTPKQGGRALMSLGLVTNLDPVKRRVSATFTPTIPVDRYRMAYLIRTVCLSELLDDTTMGYFDSATFTNATTGDVWSYSAT